MKSIKLSIIIPCLNESENILSTLKPLQYLRKRGHEIILSDGGSNDNTLNISKPLVNQQVISPAGRAQQMNAGAKAASGNVLCFLHADTLAPNNIDEIILKSFNQYENKKSAWGFFNIKLSSDHWPFRIIERLINNRSRLTQIASGDQGIFIKSETFHKISGFSDIPLMEDIEISKRLKKLSPPIYIKKNTLITSSRRWESHGIMRTVLLMWALRLGYFLGVSEKTLRQAYSNHDTKK